MPTKMERVNPGPTLGSGAGQSGAQGADVERQEDGFDVFEALDIRIDRRVTPSPCRNWSSRF